MGLYFRKSFGSGPFRINLSKSGISYSVGVKGARVNVSNRGTFVTFGGNGIYYRTKIGGNTSNHVPDYRPQPIVTSPQNPHTITSGNIDDLSDTDSQEFIRELTEKSNKLSYHTWFGICPLILIVFLTIKSSLYEHPALLGTLLLLLFSTFFFLLRRLKQLDTERMLISIHYDIDEKIGKVYDEFIRHFAELKSSAKVWQYLHAQKTNGYKYSGGADKTITRKLLTNISTNKAPSKIFRTNVDIPYLGLINTELFFFPERLIIKRQNKFAAIMYKNMNCSASKTMFIEEEGVPRDSRMVGTTWKYLNKNGTPDRRFNNNRQLPICEYSEYHIASNSGVNEIISTSKAGVFDQFIQYLTAIGMLQNNLMQKNHKQDNCV